MGKLNCWNWMNCGRYPGGPKVSEFGVCPAATDSKADGFAGGRAAGRACMYVSGTFCGGKLQGDAEAKKKNCSECSFYKALKKEYKMQVSVYKYNEYCEKGSGNIRTPRNQPWVARYTSGKEIARIAKEKYGFQ